MARTPTPALDQLFAQHCTGERFTPLGDAALELWDSGTVDVSSVPMEQVIHARLELDLPCPPRVPRAPYLKPTPPVIPVSDVTGADLRREMAAIPAPQPNVIVTAAPEPTRKPFWTRIYEAARYSPKESP